MSTKAEAERETADNLDAVRQRLSSAVRTIRVTYPDLHGIQRGKYVPISEL